MNLPIILPDLKSQRWSCHGCANCCRELVVHLTPRDRKEIDCQNWEGRIEGPAYVRLGGEFVLNHGPGGACVFLDDKGRCRIHAEFGGEAKPIACQLYPFSLHRDGDALRASLRFDCPSAGRNQGDALSSHHRDVSRLAAVLEETAPSMFAGRPPQLKLSGQRAMSEAEHEALAEKLDAWIRDTNAPFARRLVGVASIVDTLGNAKLRRFDESRFIELLDMLFDDLPAAVDDLLTASPPPPTDRQRRLLAMTIFAHCEYLRFEQARLGFLASWRHRWGQLKRARRFAGKDALIPLLVAGAEPVARSAVNAALASRPAPETGELLTRYLRARLLAGTAYGPGYYNWPAIDGLRALLLSLCSIDWLSAYCAATDNRTARTMEDIRRAVSIVDRTAGRAPELGARTALLRGNYLSQDQGILRLVMTGSWVADVSN